MTNTDDKKKRGGPITGPVSSRGFQEV